ncbi:MAG: tetratricopeptide repeat protein [Oligoflexus sp.]|nr:tetratricopeptide repeat protein [Oligoflexus sp.]
MTNPSTGEVVKKVDSDVPSEFWSPERKKANASFYYLAGEYELMNRNAAGAAKLFETAYAMEPNAFIGAKLIETKAQSNFDEGLALAKKMSLLYPHNSEIQLSYGRLLAAKGDLKEAETYLKNAVRMRPENLESSVLLIQLLQAQNKNKEAIVVAKSMVETNGDFVEGWALLARLYLVNNQPQNAIAPARKAYDLNNNDAEKIHLLAVSLLLGKQVKPSLVYFDSLIRAEHFSDDSIEKMLKLYEEIGANKTFIGAFQKADKDTGKKSDGLSFQLAVLEWGKQNFKDSSQILKELANRYPQNERLAYLLGLTQEKNGQADDALATYLKFDVKADLYAVTRVRAFDLLKRLGRNEEAIKVAMEVIDSKSDQAVAFYSLASNLLSNEGKNDEAIALVNKGLVDDPANVELLFLKAVFFEKAQKLDESIATLKEVLKRDPKHASALNYLGYMYAERNIHLEEAEGYIKRALDEKPENGFYLDSLGWVYYQQKRYKEAIVILEKAFQITNSDPTISEHLGDAYSASGDNQKALAAYKIVLDTSKEPKDLERVKVKYEMAKSAE